MERGLSYAVPTPDAYQAHSTLPCGLSALIVGAKAVHTVPIYRMQPA